MMVIETIVAVLIVAVAALWTLWKLCRIVLKGDGACAGKCESCLSKNVCMALDPDDDRGKVVAEGGTHAGR